MSRQLENSPGNRTGSTAAVQATEIASAVEVFNQRLDLGCPNVVRVA